jgi:hypothetical protein
VASTSSKPSGPSAAKKPVKVSSAKPKHWVRPYKSILLEHEKFWVKFQGEEAEMAMVGDMERDIGKSHGAATDGRVNLPDELGLVSLMVILYGILTDLIFRNQDMVLALCSSKGELQESL